MKLNNNSVFDDIKTYNDMFFNTIFCDPPYNLSAEWVVNDKGMLVMKSKAKDFMGKWDCLDGEQLDTLFREFYRVLKYGGYAIVYCIERQAFPFQYYATKNGFEVSQGLFWYYTKSMPKSTDLSTKIDSRLGAKRIKVAENPNERPNCSPEENTLYKYGSTGKTNGITKPGSDLGAKYDGYRYGIVPFKQVVENIMVFRKPPKTKTVLDDVFAYENGDMEISPAIIKIKGNEVPFENDADFEEATVKNQHGDFNSNGGKRNISPNGIYGKDERPPENYLPQGRYPSQLFIDKGTKESLDKQSGIIKAKGQNSKDESVGGCSRSNSTIEYEKIETDLLKYFPRVSEKERKEGVKNINTHLTLKPIKLNLSIMKLFKLPDNVEQKVYIPFSGAGSEIIGTILAGYVTENIFACEIDAEYVDIANQRINYYTGKKDFIDELSSMLPKERVERASNNADKLIEGINNKEIDDSQTKLF